MIDDKLDYKLLKVKNGKPFFAIVNLEVSINDSENEIIEKYYGKGWSKQGNIESVTNKGYQEWKTALRLGLEFCFSLSNNFWKVKVNKIEGRIGTDTNPTIVGYTAILAFCEQTKTKINSELKEQIEQFVFKSWENNNYNLMPNFIELKFEQI